MRANTGLGKTEMVIFGVSAELRLTLQGQVFCIGGAVIRYVAEYKHLGMVHHETSRWQADLPLRRVQGQQSLGGMDCNLASLQAGSDSALAFCMYDVCVRTVLTYGSAVWATRFHAVEPARWLIMTWRLATCNACVGGAACGQTLRSGLSMRNWAACPCTIFGGGKLFGSGIGFLSCQRAMSGVTSWLIACHVRAIGGGTGVARSPLCLPLVMLVALWSLTA